MRAPFPTRTIRAAEPTDAAALLKLFAELGYPAENREFEERVRAVLRHSDHVLLVVEDGNGTLGGCVHGAAVPILENDLTLQIFAMVVAQSHRRQGIGQSLVTAIENWARARGCLQVYLRCNVRREAAHAFWAAAGYENRKTQFAFRKKL